MTRRHSEGVLAGSRKGIAVLQAQSNSRAEGLLETLRTIDPSHSKSARSIAAELTFLRIPTPRNSIAWTAAGVLRLQERLGVTPTHVAKLKEKRLKARRAADAARKPKPPSRSRTFEIIHWLSHHPLKEGAAARLIEEAKEIAGRPFDWPDGAVRFVPRLGGFVRLDGSAITKSGRLLPGSSKARERRRKRSIDLAAQGVPGVFHPEFYDVTPVLEAAAKQLDLRAANA